MKSRLKIITMAAVAAVMMTMQMSASAQGQMSAGKSQDMNRGSMKMSSADQKFMMMAATGGMAEVEMARLALQRSANESVKQFAQKMIDDHTAAGEELKQVASTKGITLPMQPDARQMAMMAKMQRLSGAEFDMMYVKEAGVKAHQDMEKLFTKESMSGKDTDAKAFASKTLPTVRMHLQMARDMMASMKGMGSGMSDMNSNRD